MKFTFNCIQLEPEARVRQLDEFTENSNNFGSTEVIVSVAVLLTATEEVSGNQTVSQKVCCVLSGADKQ